MNQTDAVRRAGFTLVEILVVLALVGLLFALSAPSLLSPKREPASAVQAVVDAARRTAIARAAAVTLSLGADGHWALEGDEPGSGRIRSGAIDWPQGVSMRLHISPLGACMLEGTVASPPPFAIDPVRCRLAGS